MSWPQNPSNGKNYRITALGRDSHEAPLTNIYLQTPFFVAEVTATCVDQLIYDLVLWNMAGVMEPHEPDPEWQLKGKRGPLVALANTANELATDHLG